MSIAVQANQDAAPARCSIGYLYHAQSARLLRFDRFLQGRPEPAGQAPKVLLQQWTAQVPYLARRFRETLINAVYEARP